MTPNLTPSEASYGAEIERIMKEFEKDVIYEHGKDGDHPWCDNEGMCTILGLKHQLREGMNSLATSLTERVRRQALTEGIEAMPKRQGSVQDPINDSFRDGCNAYRDEAIAKLTQLRDV